MYQVSKITEVKDFLREHHGLMQGFVPTMGALHKGHMELASRARKENDLLTCSIFVNPLQFNNPDDLEKYPRTLEEDLRMLREEGCDLAFVPSVREMYPGHVTDNYEFGDLDKVMEGRYRPGHFNGVAIVVKKLFEIMQPRNAYFGEKDFQQLRIIQRMVEEGGIPVNIVPCPTVREKDGLAVSSRNRRLSREERIIAPLIYRVLSEVKKQAGETPVEDLKAWAVSQLSGSGFVVDYFEIADAESLQPISIWDPKVPARAFTACLLGKIRLIDNLELIY